ncbi:MAG TPA: 2-dehydropantoate 2-reductase [Gemmatimonadaceae bacterium]|jgi:2-dehydropantoate 2-reductase|nr:2-dehydropantoate 2-reductase [Gemmatimonadaceae bacterium]
MKILVLGAGGIGGYFGGRMADAGVDVTFLVRPRRREQLERDGLNVTSPFGDMHIPVKAITAEELTADFDVVFLACKAYDLDSAMVAIAPAMRGACRVIPMLNGMAHLEQLDERFGRASVMGGSCAINVTLDKKGTIEHTGALQRIAFGERHEAQTETAKAFAAELARTALEWQHAEDIEQNMWDKIVFLSALAAMTCLFRANIGEIMSGGGHGPVTRTLEANLAIAKAEGHTVAQPWLEFSRDRLTDPNGAWSASMLYDMEIGARVESDHIVGWMLNKARQHGIDDAMLSLAFTHLKSYEARRAADRLPARQ